MISPETNEIIKLNSTIDRLKTKVKILDAHSKYQESIIAHLESKLKIKDEIVEKWRNK